MGRYRLKFLAKHERSSMFDVEHCYEVPDCLHYGISPHEEERNSYRLLINEKKNFLFQDYLENHVNKCICSLITVRVRPMSSFKMRVSKLQDVDFGHCGFGENSEVFNGIHLCGRSI